MEYLGTDADTAKRFSDGRAVAVAAALRWGDPGSRASQSRSIEDPRRNKAPTACELVVHANRALRGGETLATVPGAVAPGHRRLVRCAANHRGVDATRNLQTLPWNSYEGRCGRSVRTLFFSPEDVPWRQNS